MLEERLVYFRPRTVLVVLGIILAAIVMIEIVQAARGILIWIFVALFLALALNPAVEWLLAHGVKRRGLAVAITFVGAILAIAAIGGDVRADDRRAGERLRRRRARLRRRPDRGRGRLGFLEREYQITDRVARPLAEGGAARLLGLSGTALAVTKGILTAVIATVTIAFLTLFMLLEGPAWIERIYGLLPEEKQPRWRASATTSTGRSAAT